MPPPKQHKFRPVLSQEQLAHLIFLCVKDSSTISNDCRKVLEKTMQFSTPAYVTTPRESIEDKLGLESSTLTELEQLEQSFRSELKLPPEFNQE